jgi:hypothetical protein
VIFLAAVIAGLHRSNAEYGEGKGSVVLSDYVSDDDSIGDGTECDGDYVEGREGMKLTLLKISFIERLR